MGRVTVVVPTANRPQHLATTLRSIARQSALDEIDEIIVSENLGNRESGAVCEAFNELPIRYLVRDPQLAAFEHISALLLEGGSEFVAMVCDDDWWTPSHLKSAIANLDRWPEAVAHCSQYISVSSELPSQGVFWGAGAIWLCAGQPELLAPFLLCHAQVLALCWAFTPFSFSTLVARHDALPSAVAAMTDSPHGYYADRLLFPALARYGGIVYEPLADACYRSYPGNWERTQDEEELQRLLRQCSDVVGRMAREAGVDPAALWRKYLAAAPPDVLEQVSGLLRNQLGQQNLLDFGLDPLLTPKVKRAPLWRRLLAATRAELLRRE